MPRREGQGLTTVGPGCNGRLGEAPADTAARTVTGHGCRASGPTAHAPVGFAVGYGAANDQSSVSTSALPPCSPPPGP